MSDTTSGRNSSHASGSTSSGGSSSGGPNSGLASGTPMQTASAMARDVKDKASSLMDDAGKQMKEQASGLMDKAMDGAKDIATTAQDKLREAAEGQKSAGADMVGNMAEAVRRAAGEFENIPQAGQYMRMAADQIEGLSTAMRDRDVGQILNNVQDFARRQPTAFLGATFLVGFALVRFLKSSTGGSATSGSMASSGSGAQGGGSSGRSGSSAGQFGHA